MTTKNLNSETLHINATKLYPEIHFKPNGNLKITGRIISDHLCDFFQPLFEWVENSICHQIKLEIDLEYLNSNGTFILVELFRRMENNSNIKDIEVIWMFEEEDED